MNKNDKEDRNKIKKDQIKTQQTETPALSKKKEKMDTNLNKSVGEIKHKKTLFGNNVSDSEKKEKMDTNLNKSVGEIKHKKTLFGNNVSDSEKKEKMDTNLNKSVGEIKHKKLLTNQKVDPKSAGYNNSKQADETKNANEPKKILDKKANMSDKLNKDNNKAGENASSIFGQKNKNKIINKPEEILDKNGSKLDNKGKDSKTKVIKNQEINTNSKKGANKTGENEFSIFAQDNLEQDSKNKIINKSEETLDKKVDMINKLNKNVSIEYKPLLLDHSSKLDNKGKNSKTEVIKSQEVNTNLKKGDNKAEKNKFSIFNQKNLERYDKTKIINELKKIFDQYEKAQYKAKLLEISGKGNVSIEQLIDCYASDVQGFGDCGPLSILESRSDNENCRMKDWRFRVFLSDYANKKLDISVVLPIDFVLKKGGYRNQETQEKFLNELILDGDFKMYNKDGTDTFYNNKKVEELRKEILNAIEEISKLYTNVIQKNEEYEKEQDLNFPFSMELIEILNYFPLNMEGNLNELVDEDTRNYEKQELLKSKININAKILFMALSYIEKKPIFCLMDSEDEKGLFVFDASRISDPKLKHKCIFRLDNNSMDNQIEYPLDLIYDFRKQLDNKDHPVFFFRSKPNHHFQYLDPKDQEKRTAFNNDMNRFFFDKCIERVLKLDSEERKKLQDELDLLQKQKAEFQTLQKMAILNSLQVLANACLIAWTSYIAYAFACLFRPIFKVCQRYVDNFRFARGLNQKISEILKSDVEQGDCFENSINDLMLYIDSTQNIERKLLEKLLPVYVIMLTKYCPQHDTENMLQKLQPFKGVQQVGIISNPDFYIKFLQNQTNDKSDKIEPNSQDNIIKDKSDYSVNSTEVTSVDENKIIPIVKPLTNETLDKNKGK